MKNLPYFVFCGRRHRAAFLLEFDRIKGNREAGRSPVFCEMRSVRTNMIESLPYNLLSGAFLILGTLLIRSLGLNELISIAIVMTVNSFCGVIANFIFTISKHALRIRFLRKMGLEPTEDNIAVLESMEYQTV